MSSLSGWFGKKKKQDEVDEQASSVGENLEDDQEPVVVWEAPNLLEAQIVVGRLKSEGIPAMIRGETAGTIFGFSTGSLAEAEVLVPAPLAERALEILESDIEWDEDDLDGSGGDPNSGTSSDNDVDADQ